MSIMTKSDRYHYTNAPKERGFLVGVDMRTHRFQQGALPVEDSLEELGALAETADVNVVGGTFQRLNKPNPATLIGRGKVEELVAFREELEVDLFIFDDELSPRQQRELEKGLDTKVLDRTALILDIFAQHARTREGMLQVELAQLEYRLPRLTRMWTHLARQQGGQSAGAGGVGVRGPGETQLEVDRREINRKIAYLKKHLGNVQMQRASHRARRQEANVPVVAIVGYTNAGKSTLLNALIQDAGVDVEKPSIYAADQLFATLDPTTRRIRLPGGHEVLFSDTVGFIQKLPTQLIAAFRATLEEVSEADILLHVIDMTHPNALEQAQVVEDTLKALQATEIPVITALNKIDASNSETALSQFQNVSEYAESIPISAVTGQGIDELLSEIEARTRRKLASIRVCLPYSAGKLAAMLHEQGIVEAETHDEVGSHFVALIPQHLVSTYAQYQESDG